MIIRNARIVDHGNETKLVDLVIEQGKIVAIEACQTRQSDQEIDAMHRLVIPGGVEVHLHLRQPGFEEKETIETGTQAAAAGGYTTVMPMPNLNPHPDNLETIESYLKLIDQNKVVNVIPYCCITKQSKGKELVDFKAVKERFGLRYFSDDGVGVQEDEMMEKAMKLAHQEDCMIIAHTEDMKYRVAGSSVHQSEFLQSKGWIGIPSETEYKQIERDLELAYKTQAKYHICHMSAKESVEALRLWKAKGADVSGEVTIHHLLLSEEDVKDTNYKMNPPLRSKEDQQAVIDGLLDGTIDFLANDHAPHLESEKQQSMDKAPFGIVTIENAIPLFYTHFVKTNKITLQQFIELISTKPAVRFGLHGKGKLEVGYDADLVILEEGNYVIDKNKFYSKGKNTPFDGWTCEIKPVMTIVKGELVWKEKNAI